MTQNAFVRTMTAAGAALLISSPACAAYTGLAVTSSSATIALDPANPTQLTQVAIHRVWANFTNLNDALFAWGGGGELGNAYIVAMTGNGSLSTGFLNHANGGLLPPESSTVISNSDSFFTIGVRQLTQIPPNLGISLTSGPGNLPDVIGNVVQLGSGGGISTNPMTSSGKTNPISMAGFTGDGDTALRVLLAQLVVPIGGHFVEGRVGLTFRVGEQTVTLQNLFFSSFLTPLTGACCLPNACEHMFHGDCHAQGAFHGIGSACGASCVVGDVTGDYRVDVDDLLAVIAEWGPCQSITCSPFANLLPCFADTNASCAVNVDDLLIVINNWSP